MVVRRECARHRRPYVLMPHGMLDPYSLTVRRWRKFLYLLAIERKNILAADRLIYTTAEEARLARNKLVSLPKGVVIPLGADAPNQNCEELASRRLYEILADNGLDVVLAAGDAPEHESKPLRVVRNSRDGRSHRSIITPACLPEPA